MEKGVINRPQLAIPEPLDAPKPVAQNRLEERNIDLIQLIGSLQNGAAGSGGSGQSRPALP